MDALSFFALFILIVLAAAIIGFVLLLGYLPGRIARDRSHPQADAVSVCGWIGILTGGLLLPVAFVWAYWSSSSQSEQQATSS